jgi:hypothetical protein
MDSYLAIAQSVLRSSRQPLSARQILKTAYQLQLVPRDLYGRTQHKTLHARLATDIVDNRSKSAFYRTGPGRFFLRSLQSDRSIPPRYREEYHAPLRAAQLGRFDVMAFPRAPLAEFGLKTRSPFPPSKLLTLPWRFVRLYNLRRDTRFVPFRFLLLLTANGRLFVDNRKPVLADGDLHRRSAIGIEGFVKRGDLSLFSADQIGLLDAAARTFFEQFDLPHHVLPALEDPSRWSKAHGVIDTSGGPAGADLVIYLSFRCAGISEIVEVMDARPSAEWVSMPITLNDIEGFDRWSSRLIGDIALQADLCI